MDDSIEYPIKISKIKEKFTQIRAIRCIRLDLIPDLFESPLGTRNKIEEDKAYPFLICDDLCGSKKKEFPVEIKNSKLFTDEPVVDWKKMKKCRPADVMWLHENDTPAFMEYIYNLLFRYVWGIPDYADRNFIYMPKKHRIYSVDDEGMGSDKEPYIQLRKNKSQLIFNFISEKQGKILKIIKAWEDDLKKVKKIVDESEYRFAKGKLNSISTMKGMKKLFFE